MISKCRKAGHPYLDRKGQIIEENVYLNNKGAAVCKACRRTGRPPGRPRTNPIGGRAIPEQERILLLHELKQQPAPTDAEREADRRAEEHFAKLYG